MKKVDCGRIGSFLRETVEVRRSFWAALLAGMILFILVLFLTTYYSVRSVFADSRDAGPDSNCTENVTQEAVHNESRLVYCLRYVKTLTATLNKHSDHCINKEKLSRDRDVLPSDHPLYESVVPDKWVCLLMCNTPMASCLYGEKCVAVKTDEFEILLDEGNSPKVKPSKTVPLKGKRLVVGGICLCNAG